jgi:aldehyde:ferredoxin oxidoreductase
MSGYVGKIARINLTTKKITYIKTSDYEIWGGGHGIGSALFFDITIREKGLDLSKIDGFHPDNLCTIMTSPLTATGIPSATGRIDVSGIGVHQSPIGWFTKSIIGGRVGPMIKFAGYDGLVLEGASAEPVWIDIRDDSIIIRPCSELGLWGMDTYETQKKISTYVVGAEKVSTWYSPENSNGRTTQKPAVIAIGMAGESRCRMACLLHGSGYAAGAGGFGAVWGSKNLKALSVVGTGSIPVADPAGIVRERLANLKEYGPDITNFTSIERSRNMLRHNFLLGAGEAYGKTPTNWVGDGLMASLRDEDKGPASCMGCYGGCRGRYKSGKANEVRCAGTYFYGQGDTREIQVEAADLINRYGFNTFDFYQGTPYIKALADNGVIGAPGSGAEIESKLDFSTFGQLKFAQDFLKTIADRDTDFGDALAEGFHRAIVRWGREADIGNATEEDKAHMPIPYWGLPEHHYDARGQLEYGYGTILGDREICEHYFTSIYWDSWWHDNIPLWLRSYDATAEEAARLSAEKMLPHASAYASVDDAMQMIDYSTANMFSEHMARLVSWHRHYTRFFKASMMYCDWRYPDIINTNKDDKRGGSFTAEEQFFKVVTGKDLSFLDSMRIGRKIWNLDNAIWTLQGRHRDMVYFADYVHNEALPEEWKMPTYDATKTASKRWAYRDVGHRNLDRKGFYEFKTRFYNQEGWDPASGWPTRTTLEDLDMGYVADELARRGKLGA